MSTAAQASSAPQNQSAASFGQKFVQHLRDHWRVLVPYAVAMLAQIPMLYLYYGSLTAQPHYQPVIIAVIATIAIAFMRWPMGHAQPYHQSLSSDLLLMFGLLAAVTGVVFVEPWFAALSLMLIVTSLFARTLDSETEGTLWPCSLPLYVYLALPMGMDVRMITTLQKYSAVYTSRLLDLAGLGHHMDGTVINVPNLKQYGIEEACSGVQSFFTLMLVAVVFVVLGRRIRTPSLGVGILSIVLALFLAFMRMVPGVEGIADQVLLVLAVGFALYALLGFRAAALILSVVFWAVFMNTIRILTIPLAEHSFGLQLSDGTGHTVLGYVALALGIGMLLSTDQFILFLFGPVEESSESGPFGRMFGRMWNSLSKGSEDSESSRRNRRAERPAISSNNQKFLWVFMGVMIVGGLWQMVDVQQSIARADKGVRFFDANVTVEFSEGDVPEEVNTWKRVKYVMENRSRGSDLGERSDIWQYRSSAGVRAVASLDQTFPGWHELTTCYRNTGWEVVGKRKVLSPRRALDRSAGADEEGTPEIEIPGDDKWNLVEVMLEKPTGEKGYLLFSHFDSFGEGLDVPSDWGTLTSFFTRAANRLSHRIRARLLRGESYQVQVFLTSYDELDPEVKYEVRERYLRIREEIRKRFVEKVNSGNDA